MIQQIRTKPVILQAMQFTEESKQDVFNWIRGDQMNIHPSFKYGKPVLVVPFIKNPLVIPYETDEEILELGDWLVREDGNISWSVYRVCKADDFKNIYEMVDPMPVINK